VGRTSRLRHWRSRNRSELTSRITQGVALDFFVVMLYCELTLVSKRRFTCQR
jgi:hypothetical protein